MMSMTRLFGRTRRKTEHDEGTASELLVRAGFVRRLAAGIYSLLPPGFNVAGSIEAVIRREMNAIGGQEILMPVVHPAELWQESGRWYEIGEEMGRFADRNSREMVLAMTHEEVVGDLVRNEIHSYRQLPALVYHIQTKWRDDPRPRAGLIRVREFTMADSYSLDADAEGLQQAYRDHFDAYRRIFETCGLPVVAVESDTGDMGGTGAHEFMYPTGIGEDTIIRCEACGYTANQQIALHARPGEEHETGTKDTQPAPLERVHTPECRTIDELASFLAVEPRRCAKAVFLEADSTEGTSRFIIVMLPGDREVNETKVAAILSAQGMIGRTMRPAREETIAAHGVVPGFGSPIGASDAFVVVDTDIPGIANMVTGANEIDYHLLNMNYPRDFEADVVSDVTSAVAGDLCPKCRARLESFNAVEVANIFQLGTRYSDPLGCTYLDAEGERRPVYMGSYGIGVGRLLACVADAHRDDRGLVWPASIAPYDVHIVDLADDHGHAEGLAGDLESLGLSVLLDDRAERAGVKFNDADLIGVPIRMTVGNRSLAKGVYEAALRHSDERKEIPTTGAAETIAKVRSALQSGEAVVW